MRECFASYISARSSSNEDISSRSGAIALRGDDFFRAALCQDNILIYSSAIKKKKVRGEQAWRCVRLYIGARWIFRARGRADAYMLPRHFSLRSRAIRKITELFWKSYLYRFSWLAFLSSLFFLCSVLFFFSSEPTRTTARSTSYWYIMPYAMRANYCSILQLCIRVCTVIFSLCLVTIMMELNYS